MNSEKMTVNARTREPGTKGSTRRLRLEGRLPAVVYGRTTEPVPVSVDPDELAEALTTPFGFNNVFMLAIDGASHQVMVKERQFDPIRRELTHVDFYVVKDEQTVSIEVPVETVGRSVGERLGGRLSVVSRTVKLSCAVRDIPATVPHDVSNLNVLDSAYIDEMTEPAGCTFIYKNRYPVIRVAKKRGAKAQAGEATA